MGFRWPPEKRWEVVERMRRTRLPFIDICAEACGVPGRTFQNWLHEDRDLAAAVYQIRAEATLKLTEDLLKPDESKAAQTNGKIRMWMIEALARTTFTPPREVVKVHTVPRRLPDGGPELPGEVVEDPIALLSKPQEP